MNIVYTLRAIFGATVFGNFLTAIVIWLLLERRAERKKQSVSTLPTPDSDSDEDAAKRAKESRENMEAWTRLQNYSAANAYGTEDSG